ncbi:MAG: PD40 domain-containing protein [Anaerolineae bacterium]|nr:PD40 domain-containing protein [Anaerolineae bacterium]
MRISFATFAAASCLLLIGCVSTPPTGVETTSEVPDVTSGSLTATEDQTTAQTAVAKTAWAVHWAEKTQTAQAPKPPQTKGPSLPTATPTATPFLTVVPTATPSGTLSPSGPWLLGLNALRSFSDDTYLWAVNPDMSGLTRLLPEPVIAYAIRPMDTISSGLTVAYATRSCQECIDITLKIVTLPGGESKTIASLYQAAADSEFSRYYLADALAGGGLAWSPDGRTLAFVGGLSGLSVDAYTYSLDTGEIKQLSDGPLHSYGLRWSPDGRYIIYNGFNWIGMGGFEIGGMWAVPAGGGANISLGGKDNSALSIYGLDFYGWLSPTQMLFSTNRYKERDSIQAVNIETGAIDIILEAQFDQAAYSPEHHTWLLARTDGAVETLGTALILCRGSDCQVVSSNKIWSVWWSSSHDVFFSLSARGELYQITPEGEVTRLPIKLLDDSLGIFPYVTESPDGARWAWHWQGHMGGWPKTYLGDAVAQPRLFPIDPQTHIRQITWSPDSQHLLLFGETNTYIARQPDFEPVLAIDGWAAQYITWVQ